MKNFKILALIGLVVVVAVAGIIYSRAVKPAPPDNAQLTEIKFEGLMGSRYTEILLVFGNALTSRLHGRRLQHRGSERRQPRWRR